MKFLRFAPLFVAIAPLWAASISVSTYCNPLTSQTNTGTSASCSGTAPDGSFRGLNFVSTAQAQASAAFTLLPDGFAFGAATHAQSGSNGNIQPFYVDATATATITATIDTAGPLRSGFVVLACGTIPGFDCSYNFNGGAGSGDASATLGSAVTCHVAAFYYCPGLRTTIELGQPLQFEMNAQASACGAADCDSADGYGSIDLVATLYDADGTTPVAVSEIDPVATPEPAAPLLMAVGLLVLGLTRVRR